MPDVRFRGDWVGDGPVEVGKVTFNWGWLSVEVSREVVLPREYV